ncbi:HNH endonuclease signature motif containing protein [Rummeliibacillus stabekisii]|uniref:HNH endonuclease signature motif containing protein n=1 Tax=Rummeliibacillus stabekisii TaxID=241244 RepID=UPI00371489B2
MEKRFEVFELENGRIELFASIGSNHPNHMVSLSGDIINIKTNRLLRGKTDKDGYKSLGIKDQEGKLKWYQIHRLVLSTFSGQNGVGLDCDHINGIRNDNRLENLRFITHQENMAATRGRKRKKSVRLKDEVKTEIRNTYIPYHSELGHKALRDKYNISPQYLNEILKTN